MILTPTEYLDKCTKDVTDDELINMLSDVSSISEISEKHMYMSVLSFLCSIGRERVVMYIFNTYKIEKLEYMELYFIIKNCMVYVFDYIILNDIQVNIDPPILKMLVSSLYCNKLDVHESRKIVYSSILDKIVEKFPTNENVLEYTANRDAYIKNTVAEFEKFVLNKSISR